jgi:hypothetical protein
MTNAGCIIHSFCFCRMNSCLFTFLFNSGVFTCCYNLVAIKLKSVLILYTCVCDTEQSQGNVCSRCKNLQPYMGGPATGVRPVLVMFGLLENIIREPLYM